MRDRKRVYLEIWSRIENIYFNGYLASERTLQAALYTELRNTLPDVNVVVEPTWNVGIPDLVIVEKGQITDIFELKFNPKPRPQDFPVFEEDIQHLLLYGANGNEAYPVRRNINSGEWEDELPVWNACRLHFVVVANCQAAAVWPKCLVARVPELQNNPGRLNHWFGRVGGDTDEKREWSIEFGIR